MQNQAQKHKLNSPTVTLLTCGGAKLWNSSLSASHWGRLWSNCWGSGQADSISSRYARRIRNARRNAHGDRGRRNTSMRLWEAMWRSSLRGEEASESPGTGTGHPTCKGKENWGSRDKTTREQSPQERWSMCHFQPTGKDDVDFTIGICCHLQEDTNRVVWGKTNHKGWEAGG